MSSFNGFKRPPPVIDIIDAVVGDADVYQEEIELFGTDDKLVRTHEDGGFERWVEVLVAASGRRLVWDWGPEDVLRSGEEALAWLKTVE
jgi:hypothetical protein